MSWDHNRYLAKAQIYWAQATGYERDSDRFLLTVAFTCEFLARAVLTSVNPALNAASDTESVLFASGIEPKTSAKSVDIMEGLNRVQRLITTMPDVEIANVKVLISARNQELHSDESALATVDIQAAMPAAYGFMVKCCTFLQHDPKVLMGDEDGAMAMTVSDASQKDRKRRVADLIRIHKDRFYGGSEKEQLAAREKAKSVDFSSAVLKSGHHVRREKCPACAESALLAGPPVGRSEPFLKDGDIVREVRISPSILSCVSCELHIKGLDELMAAGYTHEFHVIDTLDPVEHFSIDPLDYINPIEHVDIDQIIREHASGYYEYQDE